MTRKTDKEDKEIEIERRTKNNLMAKQLSQIHSALYTDDGEQNGWLVKRIKVNEDNTEKNTDDIKAIKVVWSTITVVAGGLWAILTHFWSRGK